MAASHRREGDTRPRPDHRDERRPADWRDGHALGHRAGRPRRRRVARARPAGGERRERACARGRNAGWKPRVRRAARRSALHAHRARRARRPRGEVRDALGRSRRVHHGHVPDRPRGGRDHRRDRHPASCQGRAGRIREVPDPRATERWCRRARDRARRPLRRRANGRRRRGGRGGAGGADGAVRRRGRA